MCGRIVQDAAEHDLRRLFDLQGGDFPAAPRYNIAPTQPVAAVRRADGGGREGFTARWGLVPHWASDPRIGSRMFNARAETVAEKPAFRDPFRARRCLVPMRGFYEWRADAGGKQPYFICRADRQIMAAAGVWDAQEELESCAVITVEANAAVRPIHHRMPALIEQDDWSAWLGWSIDSAAALLRPSGAELTARPVSRRVNSAANDDPACMEPAEETGQGALF